MGEARAAALREESGLALAACPEFSLARFREGVLPIMKAYCEDRFEAPENLSLALAAMILMYAGARWENGVPPTA